MIASRCGYVGICMTDGQMVDLAAAIDPATIKHDQPIKQGPFWTHATGSLPLC
jgi:hypothetical protein